MEGNEKNYCSCTPADIAAVVGANNNPLYSLLANRGGFGGDNDLLILLLLLLGNGGYGNNRTTPEIESLRNQIADNKNSSDLMAIMNQNTAAIQQLSQMTNQSVDRVKDGLCAINAGVAKLSGDTGMGFERVINSVITGGKDMQAAFAQCCCENKLLVQGMGYEGQLRDQQNHAATMSRIDQLAQRLTEGFSATAYEQARLHAESLRAGEINTQRIIDTMNNHWGQAQAQELADAKLKLSQVEQNAYLLAQLKAQCGCGCN